MRISRAFRIAILATLLFAGSAAEAQVPVQIQYMRPAKGVPILLFDSIVLNDAMTAKTTAFKDWSAFSAMNIEVTFSAITCKWSPEISVLGSPTPTGTYNGLTTRNATRDITNLYANYAVRTPSPNIKIVLNKFNSGGVTAACTVSVWATPLPFEVPDSPTSYTAQHTIVSVTSAGAEVLVPSYAGRTAILQNHSTQAVFCDWSMGTVPAAPLTNPVIILSAGTAANDGTGGSMTIDNWNGSLYCAVTAGSSNVGVFAW